jgi:hypothetical protein
LIVQGPGGAEVDGLGDQCVGIGDGASAEHLRSELRRAVVHPEASLGAFLLKDGLDVSRDVGRFRRVEVDPCRNQPPRTTARSSVSR